MPDNTKYLVLAADPETNLWSIVVDSAYEEQADSTIENMKKSKDPSLVIKICTDDYVTVNE